MRIAETAIALSIIQEIFAVLKPAQPSFSQFWLSQSQPRISRAVPSLLASSPPESSQVSQLISTQMTPASTPYGLTAFGFTQSPSTRLACGHLPLDNILNGGLRSGHILEISGPPGTAKETLAVGFVKGSIKNGDEVLFVGMLR